MSCFASISIWRTHIAVCRRENFFSRRNKFLFSKEKPVCLHHCLAVEKSAVRRSDNYFGSAPEMENL